MQRNKRNQTKTTLLWKDNMTNVVLFDVLNVTSHMIFQLCAHILQVIMAIYCFDNFFCGLFFAITKLRVRKCSKSIFFLFFYVLSTIEMHRTLHNRNNRTYSLHFSLRFLFFVFLFRLFSRNISFRFAAATHT